MFERSEVDQKLRLERGEGDGPAGTTAGGTGTGTADAAGDGVADGVAGAAGGQGLDGGDGSQRGRIEAGCCGGESEGAGDAGDELGSPSRRVQCENKGVLQGADGDGAGGSGSWWDRGIFESSV